MLKRVLPVATVVTAGAVIGYRTVVRPWQERWGATDDEVIASLPGDDLVAEPASQVTRAVTIAAERADVWPWVVQLGAERGGFYSYDWLENLVGLHIHSADTIVPEWQHRAVGDLVHGNRAGTGGWYVAEVHQGKALVLQMANIERGRPARRDDPWGWEFLWTFALLDGPAGTTRLLVRERAAFARPIARAVMSPVALISFVMTRKMLLGIKARAEAAAMAEGGVGR